MIDGINLKTLKEWLPALRTQYQIRGEAIVPRNSMDAPSVEQMSRIRSAHYSVIPLVEHLIAFYEAAKTKEQPVGLAFDDKKLDELWELAKRDDFFDLVVPSTIRQLIGDIRRLKAPEREVSSQGKLDNWRPIETALKDGRGSLLFWLEDEGFAVKARWCKPPLDETAEECWWCFEMDCTLDFCGNATHWMPMPEGPSSSNNRRRGSDV